MVNRQRTAGIILSYVQLISNVIINLAYVPFLIRNLGDNEYGLYQLMGSLIAYFSVFDFGLSNSIIRFYSLAKANNEKDKEENILALSLLIYGGISLVCLICGGVIGQLIGVIFRNSLTTGEIMEAKLIFAIQLFNIVVSLMGKVFNAVVTSEERFIFLKALGLLQCYLQPIAIYCLVLKAPYATTVVMVQTVANVLINVVTAGYVLIKLRTKIWLHSFDFSLLSQMMKLSLSVFVVAITDQVFWKTNQFALGAVLGTYEVAVYAVAAQIYMNYMALSSTIQGVFLPKITQMVAKDDPDNITDIFVKIGKVQFLLLSLVMIGFISIGRDFIALWVGENYYESYVIALVIMVAMSVDLIQCIGSTVLQAQNQYAIRAKILLICAIVNLFAVCFVAKSGGVACAIASAICMLIANGPVMNYYYKKIAGLDVKKYWRAIGKDCKQLVLTLIVSIGISMVPLGVTWQHLILKGCCIILVYMLLMKDELQQYIKKR